MTNHLLSLAHAEADTLRQRLAELPTTATVAQREATVRVWVGGLGRRINTSVELVRISRQASAEQLAAAEGPRRPSAMLATWQAPPPPPPRVAQLGKWERRWALVRYQAKLRRRHGVPMCMCM